MSSIILGVFFIILAIGAFFVPLPEQFNRIRRFGSMTAILLGAVISLSGGVSYNDAGVCVHVRTIAGTEKVKCDIGWYISGWGTSNEYPHFITVSHTQDPTAGSVSDLPPYTIRMADNWAGTVIQTTRFGIPQDEEQFLRMAHDYRSYERLVVTLLRPAVTSSLDSIANLYSMEDYWSGGKRDEFKTEFEAAVQKGRPAVDRVEKVVSIDEFNPEITPSDSSVTGDTARTGSGTRTVVTTVKRLDDKGNEIRVAHDYADYGITVSSAIIEQIDPDDAFEDRIKERKEAASRRIIAQERRLEEEEQRLLAITKSEREIAERQGQARVEQIQKTTEAETSKRLALIESEKIREQANISKQTAVINLDKSKIDAEAVKITADADAYAREKLLLADNALKVKLEAEIAIQKVWADAYAKRNVPQIVMGGNGSSGTPVGSDSEVKDLLNLLTADTARRLSYDRNIVEKVK